MKTIIKMFFASLIFSFGFLSVYAGEWLDEFDKAELNKDWIKITDRPAKLTTIKIEKGRLLMYEQTANFGHTIVDGRPLILRKAPKGDFSISMLVDTIPPAPAGDYWLGLFIIGKDGNDAVLAENWAVLTIGGSKGERKTLIGSMINNTWNDKGHFDVKGWPIYLKLEKIETTYTGYYKEKPDDQWTKVGDSWKHEMKTPELVGMGFINNWGGTKVTMVAEYFSLQGDNVSPMAVQSIGKITNTWGEIKSK